jgi:tetratricopeptide (TPR) repeat protein
MVWLGIGALSLRALYLLELWPTPLFSVLFGDGRQYVAWAQEIAGGQWLGTSVFYQSPLYPYVLALLFKATGASVGAVRVVQALLGTASCLLVAHAGRRFVGDRAGLAAGWLLAIYPPAVFFDGLVQKSSLDLFLVSALLALLGEFVTRRSWPWMAAAGLALGLFTLNRENARVLSPVVGLWTWWCFGDESRRRRGGWIAALTIAVLVTVLPVGIRNYAVGGEFMISTSQLGPNFYIGNHAGARGAYESLLPWRGTVIFEREDATRLAEQALGRTLSPGDVSDYWVRRAISDIRSQPGAWIRLLGRKLLLTVNAREVADTESIEVFAEYSRVLGTLYWFNFGVVLPLAAFGAWTARAHWRRLMLIAASGAALVLSVAAFYVMGRYRYPIVPMAMIFAGAGAVGLLDVARAVWRRRPPLGREIGPGFLLAGFVTVLANVPFQAGGDDTRLNIGEELLQSGRVDEALALLAREAAASPDYPKARLALGVALSKRGEKARALDEFRAAVSLDPGNFDARSALGLALAESGNVPGALEHFQEAVRLKPGDVAAEFNLANALQQSGRPGEAAPHYEAALRARPDYVEALSNLALALAASGDPAGGIERLDRASRLRPDSAALHFNLAEFLNDARRPAEALPHYQKAAELSPGSLELQYALAQAYARSDRWAEALGSLETSAVLARAAGRTDALREIEAAIRDTRARIGGRK